MDKLTVKKNASFFIALAKQGIHSFLMLGVIDSNGAPQLLSRIGKTNDVDEDTGNDWALIKKELFSSCASRIADEGLTRKDGHVVDISYQAHKITLKQYKEYLHLLADIEQKQKAAYKIPEKDKKNYTPITSLHEGIDCYVPITPENDSSDSVSSEYKKLSDVISQTDTLSQVD